MWLADKIRRVLSVFDSEEHCMAPEEVKSQEKYEGVVEDNVPDINEPVLSFITEVENNHHRFEWYEGDTTLSYYGKKQSTVYLLIDTLLNKSFTYKVRFQVEVLTGGNFRKGNFVVQGEDISWLTEDEDKLLLKLHFKMKERVLNLEHVKCTRMKANQRRELRKLYETK